jgi:hypothetical protein
MPKTPTRALTTEIAAHFERKDLGLMGQLYRSGVPLSVVLSTWFLYKTRKTKIAIVRPFTKGKYAAKHRSGMATGIRRFGRACPIELAE